MPRKDSREIEIEFPSLALREEFECEAAANAMTPSEFLFDLLDKFRPIGPRAVVENTNVETNHKLS
jgi:hypothetical protein